MLLPFEDVTVDDELIPKPLHRLLVLNKPENCLCERLRGGHSWCRARGLPYGSDKAVAERDTAKNRLMARASRAQGTDMAKSARAFSLMLARCSGA